MGIWSYVITISLGLIIGLIVVSYRKVDRSAYHVINKEDFKNNMRKGQLIDVRKKNEFKANKIKGARNFTVGQLSGKYSKLRKDSSVYLYCNNGRKSLRTARKMSKKGFKNIYILENGFNKY